MGYRDVLKRVPLLRPLVLKVRPSVLNIRYRLGPGTDYPDSCAVGEPNWEAIDFARSVQPRVIAEVGIYKGLTSEHYARLVGDDGTLHLFDFADRVRDVTQRLHALGFRNVVGHGNSRRTYDSYAWSLATMLRDHSEPVFDFVMIDGAHTWHHDGYAFLLCDRLLKPGGHVYFDDYDWTLASSTSLNPRAFPKTRKMFTSEQIEEPQVRLVIDLLVRRDPRYVEVIADRAFRKAA